MLLVLENEEGGSASEYGWSLEKKKIKPDFLLKLSERNRWILVQLNIY